MRKFEDRRAVVTGAGSGIGREIALNLVQRGAHVVATDIGPTGLAELAAEADGSPGTLFTHLTDVADEASVTALKRFADESLGSVDLLFNNAGVAYNTEPTWRASSAAVEWCYGVNVFGVLNGLRAFVPDMVERGLGHIVNTASIGGFQVSTRTDVWQQGLYASTKYAVVAISEGLAAELAGSGVTVSVLAPSAVATGIAHSGAHRPERYGGATAATSPEAMVDMIAAEGLPPRDVAEMALRAVSENRFYVFTDTNLRGRIRERAAAIDAAFDDLPRREEGASHFG